MKARRPLRLLVSAAAGRMGGRVAALALEQGGFEVLGGLAHRRRPGGGFAGPVFAWTDLPGLLARADVVVDFSAPKGCLALAAQAAQTRTPLVTGTTGLSAAQRRRLETLSRRTAILAAPNFSPGACLLAALARQAAQRLAGYDAAVCETHHRAKRDAPSGTALRLAEAARQGGAAAASIVSLRLGDVVGDHAVVFAGPGERVELVHRAQSRDVFARGALSAARWLAGRRPGLYGLEDALGTK